MSEIDTYIKETVEKYHRQIEEYTKDEFENILYQLIESGDFMRLTQRVPLHKVYGRDELKLKSYESVSYIPFRNSQEQQSKINTLTKQVEVLKEAVEFYGDHDNYEKMEGSYGRSYQNYHSLITEEDCEDFIGGKKARQALEKYKESR